MEFYDALYSIAREQGISVEALSLKIGRVSSFITSSKSRGSKPKVDTAARMVDGCDYVLCAIPSKKVPKCAVVIDGTVVE